MNTTTQDTRNWGFGVGLCAGAVVGAGLALWFAPRLRAELGQWATDAARDVADRATATYDRTTNRVAGAVDDITARGQNLRDGMADGVVHGAQAVEQYAAAAKSGRIADIKKDARIG